MTVEVKQLPITKVEVYRKGDSALDMFRVEKGLPNATFDEMMQWASGRQTVTITNKQDGNTIAHGLNGRVVTRFFDTNYQLDERVYTEYDTNSTVIFKTRILEDIFNITFNGFLLCERI